MPKIVSSKDAATMILSGSSVMFGGFLAVGCPENIIDSLVESNVKDLHLICISSDYEDRGVGKLIVNEQVKSAQVSHLGTNKTMQAQRNSGQTEVEMIPQGSLMEGIRAQGAGLGGVLTPTGIGTEIAENREQITIDGKEYLIERAISADFAIIRAYKADTDGNLIYYKTSRNSNPVMAMAGKITIVEVDEVVQVGQLSPEEIVTPGIFVDYIVLHK